MLPVFRADRDTAGDEYASRRLDQHVATIVAITAEAENAELIGARIAQIEIGEHIATEGRVEPQLGCADIEIGIVRTLRADCGRDAEIEIALVLQTETELRQRTVDEISIESKLHADDVLAQRDVHAGSEIAAYIAMRRGQTGTEGQELREAERAEVSASVGLRCA